MLMACLARDSHAINAKKGWVIGKLQTLYEYWLLFFMSYEGSSHDFIVFALFGSAQNFHIQ